MLSHALGSPIPLLTITQSFADAHHDERQGVESKRRDKNLGKTKIAQQLGKRFTSTAFRFEVPELLCS
jgi:hypothetical protein